MTQENAAAATEKASVWTA